MEIKWIVTIAVVSILVVVGAIIIGLWQGDVIFSSSDDIPSRNWSPTATVANIPYTGGMYMDVRSIKAKYIGFRREDFSGVDVFPTMTLLNQDDKFRLRDSENGILVWEFTVVERIETRLPGTMISFDKDYVYNFIVKDGVEITPDPATTNMTKTVEFSADGFVTTYKFVGSDNSLRIDDVQSGQAKQFYSELVATNPCFAALSTKSDDGVDRKSDFDTIHAAKKPVDMSFQYLGGPRTFSVFRSEFRNDDTVFFVYGRYSDGVV